MHSLLPARSSSWGGRVRELLNRLLRPPARDARRLVVWAEMKPIDFEGEDTSLTEGDLRHMK